MPRKPISWQGSSRDALATFPDDARIIAGHQLVRLQHGLSPLDWQPVTRVGMGVAEIRVQTSVELRVFYAAKFDEAVYVLHAFEKRAVQTSHREMALARKRLADLPRRRTEKPEASGNVFRDLGFSAEDATSLSIRSDLMIRLGKVVETRGLTQARAAELFRVTQPRVSDLVRGKIERFSIDTLIAMLSRSGIEARVVLPT